jgi:hypothetical protein
VRRWVRAFLAQTWEACVLHGRLSAGERLTGTGPGGHPERVPPPDAATPEDLAFWAQVAPLREEILARDRRRRHG